ncbi:hypothetical protein IF1G_00160 [Cordyceps javanica]|uniref:Uncharacterized protein n=1 Tax=Cordyceps javanica TaxID=43265 RepID=A0A545WC22_9HYPO|nr:hypothetical protein IF1G_00160 [Cordyceps javanica]TQW11425.1 hypothetical protein IF2G_00156 [Cordyceps javanica]
MYSLPLLLGAAAGVNAIFGANIEAVLLDGNQYLCADSCAHQGFFFGPKASCRADETVLSVDEDDQPVADAITGGPFYCRGDPTLSSPYVHHRERKAGETPEQCDLWRYEDPDRLGCFVYKMPGEEGPDGETLQWADVAKLAQEDTRRTPPGRAPSRSRSRSRSR